MDKKIEQAIFIAMSEDGTGPRCFYQDEQIRIEEFFEGRPLTIWEMRNPMVAATYARKVCDLNFSKRARDMVLEFEPLDPNNLFIHQVIKEWAPNLKNKIDWMKE